MDILIEIPINNQDYILRYKLIVCCLLGKDIEGNNSKCKPHFVLNLKDLITKWNVSFNLLINFGHKSLKVLE